MSFTASKRGDRCSQGSGQKDFTKMRDLAYALIREILGTIFPVFPRQKRGDLSTFD